MAVADRRSSAITWLLEPLNTLASPLRSGLVVALVALILATSVHLLRGTQSPFLTPDANQYVHLAKGEISEIRQPFASRPFAPLMVRGLASILHTSVEKGFFIVGLGSLALTLLVIFGLAARSAAPRWFLFAMAALPFWPTLLHGYVLPDIWYAAMLCCLLLCMVADKPLLAALMFFPLMLSRESTSLTLLCVLVVGWRWLRLGNRIIAVAATLAAALLVRHLSTGAGSNPENLPEPIYLAAKIPWNLARTLGISPWSNLYPFLCNPPAWQHALRIGPLRSIGVCGLSDISPLQAVFALFTVFGLLTPLFFFVWRRRSPIAPGDVLTRFCLLYGGLSFLLAPMLGTAFQRLFGYAWPLFLVALPRLFPDPIGPAKDRNRGIWALLAVAALLTLQVGLAAIGLEPASVAEDAAAAILEALGIALLISILRSLPRSSSSPGGAFRRGKIETGKSPEQADFS